MTAAMSRSFERVANAATLRLTKRLALLFAAIAGAAVLASVVAVFQVDAMDARQDAVEHTYSVRAAIRRIATATTIAEAAARAGPTDDRGEAAIRFAAAEAAAWVALIEFSGLTLDNADQTATTGELALLLQSYFPALRQAARPPPDSRDFWDAAAAQRRILSLADGALESEARLLTQRRNAFELSLTQSRWLFLGIAVLTLVGLVTAFYLVLRELRRRQQTEAALQAQSHLLSATFESMDQGVLVLDGQMRVLAANPWARELFALPPDWPCVGARYADILRFAARAGRIGEGDLEARVAEVAAAIAGSAAEQSEVRLRDGRTIEIQRRPYADGGVVSTYTDVTERRRIELVKNEFISTVSHELRTPLTSIRGSLGLVIGGAVGEIAAKAREMIAIAHANSERLVRLINDILDIERIETGRMPFELREHELAQVVAQSLEANAGYFAQYDVRPILHDLAPGAVVCVDPDRIAQVLNNLLSNAAKNSHAGGSIDVVLTRSDGRVRLSVGDSGPGIPEAFRSRIFGKFEQADSSDARRKGGTGLGLSIVKAIVERLDGRIWFDTEIGVGTTFHVDLPEMAARDASPRARPRPEHAPASSAARVLVVEDDQDVAHLLSLMLEQQGWRVTVAHSAAAARVALAGAAFAAMTLDIMLPDEDGLTFFRELRRCDATRGLPVVVVSAKAEVARRAINGDAIGIVDWLEKPVDQERLARAVHAAVGTREGPIRILHVEDDPDIVRILSLVMGAEAEVRPATTLAAAREALANERFELVIVDVGLPDGSGLDLLAELRLIDPPPPVVIFSARDFDAGATTDVAAALVKSRTDNAALHDTIHKLIDRLAGRSIDGEAGR